ncbi:aldose epimerase family protein [Sphingomonas xinjiangensis]|uniref:Aldose 1-epimerase n=1 Tax=Sphingomonas xinjiangensis TaxID=643568 RepID=A0A840YPK8_9SPHN|nr:aldose 1-epimerase [Sphingomonas xinjiangensis]
MTAILLSHGREATAQAVSRDVFGTLPDGRAVERFRLTNARGTSAALIEYGASITSIRLKDRGRSIEVVVGPNDLTAFTKRRFGQIVGRYAGRLRGEVLIEGFRYPLATNAAGVTVHGGDPGLDRELWRGTPFFNAKGSGVTFKLVSPSGKQGFPGILSLEAQYFLARNSDTLTLDIRGSADRPTIASLTNHVFFNLAGVGTVACHVLEADASRYVQIDHRKLPTGALQPVRDTRFDFTMPRLLAPLLRTGGLDDMIVLEPGGAVHLHDRRSGRTLRMTTNQPGVQVFTGNGFDGSILDGRGRPIMRHAGVAVEAMGLPDSPWFPHFPSTAVSPFRPLHWRTEWAFSTARRQRGSCSDQTPHPSKM